jgi:hypothetical protein
MVPDSRHASNCIARLVQIFCLRAAVREPGWTLTTAARDIRPVDPRNTGVAFLPRDTNRRQLVAGRGMGKRSALAPDLALLLPSWELALRAERKARRPSKPTATASADS